jgi:hypothetical protein
MVTLSRGKKNWELVCLKISLGLKAFEALKEFFEEPVLA